MSDDFLDDGSGVGGKESESKSDKKDGTRRVVLMKLRRIIQPRTQAIWHGLRGEQSDGWMHQQYLAALKADGITDKMIAEMAGWALYQDDKRSMIQAARVSANPKQFTLELAQASVFPTGGAGGVVKVADATWAHIRHKVELVDVAYKKLVSRRAELHDFADDLKPSMQDHPDVTVEMVRKDRGQW